MEPAGEGWIKANVDGQLTKNGNNGGGVIYRDHERAYRGVACAFFAAVASAEHAELLTRKRAVKLAIDLNLQKLHVEMDCMAVVRMLNDPGKNMSVAEQVIEEIKAMLRTRQEFNVTWVRRSANSAAHYLAREGVCNKVCREWLNYPPDCILGIVADEIPVVA